MNSVDRASESASKPNDSIMAKAPDLLATPLHRWHVDNGGRMVDFAGWSMPVQYGSIINEHHHTRNAIGMFDVSHMGRIFFSGVDVDRFLDRLTTRRVAGVEAGKIRYSLMTNEAGGILDDVLFYHLPGLDGEPDFYMLVVNAGNREKILNWLAAAVSIAPEISVVDRTTETAMIAVQGPLANEIVAQLSEIDPSNLAYFTGVTTLVAGRRTILSRTGYTGEDGCELIVEAADAQEIWNQIYQAAVAVGGGATGLAARDTLRLEAAMPLYGHELSEMINPVQAGLSFAVQLKDRDFIGRAAIIAAKKQADLPVRAGLELAGKRAAREDCQVFVNDKNVGTVTSGTFAPTLEKSISMAYLHPTAAKIGTEVDVDIRGKRHPAKVVELPFYQRKK